MKVTKTYKNIDWKDYDPVISASIYDDGIETVYIEIEKYQSITIELTKEDAISFANQILEMVGVNQKDTIENKLLPDKVQELNLRIEEIGLELAHMKQENRKDGIAFIHYYNESERRIKELQEELNSKHTLSQETIDSITSGLELLYDKFYFEDTYIEKIKQAYVEFTKVFGESGETAEEDYNDEGCKG